MAPRMRNIFVVGLDDFHRHLLESVRGAEGYRFHGLIPYKEIVNPASYPIDDLLAHGRRQIEGFGGTVDAIIGHWDFPTTSLLPVLRGFAGLGDPRLEAMLACDHKYWMRHEQALVDPRSAPPFAVVDPRAHDVLEKPPLEYPFWLKPVVAFSSYLGFRVENDADLAVSTASPSRSTGWRPTRAWTPPTIATTARAVSPRDSSAGTSARWRATCSAARPASTASSTRCGGPTR